MHTAPMAFYASMFLSRLADQVLLFLVPLVVFQVTQSAAWAGLAFAVETLPRFVAYPVCGALCDRVAPFRLLRNSQWLRALACALGAAASAWSGNVVWLVALAAVCGVLTTQGMMAREVMLPQVFPGVRYETVLAQGQMAEQAGMVLGPLLAALALQALPWAGVVAATAALFLLGDAALQLWRRHSAVQLPAPPQAASTWPGLAPYRTAWQQVCSLPGLLPLVVATAGVNLVVGATQATAAAMVTGLLQQSEQTFALLQAAGAVATVLVLLWVARSALALGSLGRVAYAALAAGALAMALANSLAVYALGYLAVTGFDKMYSVYVRSRRQKIIPAADFGKTSGMVVLLNNLSQPLAGLVVGLFAAGSDPRGVVLALTLGMGLLGWLALAMQRQRDRPIR
jgi:MFS family permease